MLERPLFRWVALVAAATAGVLFASMMAGGAAFALCDEPVRPTQFEEDFCDALESGPVPLLFLLVLIPPAVVLVAGLFRRKTLLKAAVWGAAAFDAALIILPTAVL